MKAQLSEFKAYMRTRVSNLVIIAAHYGEPCYEALFVYKGRSYRCIVSIYRVGKKIAKKVLRRCDSEKSNTTIEMEFYLRDITEQAKP